MIGKVANHFPKLEFFCRYAHKPFIVGFLPILVTVYE